MTTLPPSDDGVSSPIYISGGLPLGTTTHTTAHVSSDFTNTSNFKEELHYLSGWDQRNRVLW